MPKMINPDTQEVVEVGGQEVKSRKAAGFVTVGNRPEAEYLGKTREELRDDDDDEGEGEDQPTGDIPPAT
jgi:hypothetical protein